MKHAVGAYILKLIVERSFVQRVGALGEFTFEKGTYLYVGSAKGSIEGRTRRHRRLAKEKKGKLHWHIDYLLTNDHVSLDEIFPIEGGEECRVARYIAGLRGVSVPAKGFGSSDCSEGCTAHLFKVGARQSFDEIERAIKGLPKNGRRSKAF